MKTKFWNWKKMKNKILIVGGYGKVGSNVAKILIDSFPDQLIIAGRNFDKAKKFSKDLSSHIIPKYLDVNAKRFSSELFENVQTVIMCLDITNTLFVEECFKNKANYIDITATHEIIHKIQKLSWLAEENEVTSVLSVGLAPGMTNLMTKNTLKHFDNIFRTDIFIMIGAGEKHGKEAINWTLENMNKSFEIYEEGKKTIVKSFRENKVSDYPEGSGNRKFYRFSFSDQIVISDTMNIPSVSTWMCLDSKFLTTTLAWFKLIYKFQIIKRIFSFMFLKVSFGSDIFILKVVTNGKKDGEIIEHSNYFKGNREGEMTAMIVSAVVNLLNQSKNKHGVFHIDQLFSIYQILEFLSSKTDFRYVE